MLDFLSLLSTPLQLPSEHTLLNVEDYTPKARTLFWNSLKNAIDWTREALSCMCDIYFAPNALKSILSNMNEETESMDMNMSNDSIKLNDERDGGDNKTAYPFQSEDVICLLEALVHNWKQRNNSFDDNASNVISHVNDLIGCLLIDRYNQLIDMEHALFALSHQFPSCVDRSALPNLNIDTSSALPSSRRPPSPPHEQSNTGTQASSSMLEHPDNTKKSKKKKSTTTMSDPFDVDRISYEDCKKLIAPAFRMLRPSVAALMGYGIKDYSYTISDVNILLKLAATRTDVPDETNTAASQSKSAASGTATDSYSVIFTNAAVNQLLMHISMCLEHLQTTTVKTPSSTSSISSHQITLGELVALNLDTKQVGECGITTVKTYLSVLYENKGFVAIHRILSSIVAGLSESDDVDRMLGESSDQYGCLNVDVDDELVVKATLKEVLRLLASILSSCDLVNEVLEAYEQRYRFTDADDTLDMEGMRQTSRPLLLCIMYHLVNGEVNWNTLRFVYVYLHT